MRFHVSTKIIAGLFAFALGFYACTPGGGDGEETPTETPGGDGDTTPDTRALFKDLGISKIYQFKMPFHVNGARYVPLFDEDRDPEPPIEPKENLSEQSCRIRDALHSASNATISAGQLFCQFEKIEGLKVGVKYHIVGKPEDPNTPVETEFTMQVWADDSKLKSDGYVTVHSCENKVLKEVIRLKSKGPGRTLAVSYGYDSYKSSRDGPEDTDTHHIQTMFDIGYSVLGQTMLTSRYNYVWDRVGDRGAQYSEVLYLKVSEDGVSKIATAETYDNNRGESERKTSFRRYVGLFSKDLGTSIDQYGNEPSTGTPTTVQDYFDGTNTIVPKASRPEFAEGGSHYLTAADLPQGLPYDVSPPNYPEGAWDCEGTEQELELVFTKANRKICSIGYNYPRICDTPTRVTTNQETLGHNGTGLVEHSVFEQELTAIKELNFPTAPPP